MVKKYDRSLKILGYHRDNKQVPELRLSGVWMEQLGFTIGDRVSITTRDRLLIIEPLEPKVEEVDYKAVSAKVEQALQEIRHLSRQKQGPSKN